MQAFMSGKVRLVAIVAIAVIVGGVLLSTCNEPRPLEERSRSITLVLTHPPELADYLARTVERFALTNPKLPDGRDLVVKLVSEEGVRAAQRIASGEVKTDLWLAPASALVDYVNRFRRNLGPTQTDCVQLFASPIVLAVQPRHLPLIQASDREFSWSEFFATQLAAQGKGRPSFSFSHGTVGASASGIAALTQLSYLAAGSTVQLLDADLAKSPKLLATLRQFEGFASHYGNDERLLLRRAADPDVRDLSFSLATEQQVVAYNATRADHESGLLALYAKEGTYWQEYPLCLSAADWVTPAHRAAARLLTEFLRSADAQFEAEKLGFRPSVLPPTGQGPLNRQHGVDTSRPQTSFPPITGDTLQELLTSWPDTARPAAVLLVIDTSGSMEGAPLRVGKDELRKLVARFSSRDRLAVMRFATRSELLVDFTPDAATVMRALDSLASGGGSALYDTLRQAIDTFVSREDLRNYRRAIVLLTDGEDKNSDISLPFLLDYTADSIARNDIALTVIGLKHDATLFTDLREVARVANGLFFEADFETIGEAFGRTAEGL